MSAAGAAINLGRSDGAAVAAAKRVADDFDVETQREQLLEDIATEYASDGFNAVFYDATADYHALQTKLTRRFASEGLEVLIELKSDMIRR